VLLCGIYFLKVFVNIVQVSPLGFWQKEDAKNDIDQANSRVDPIGAVNAQAIGIAYVWVGFHHQKYTEVSESIGQTG